MDCFFHDIGYWNNDGSIIPAGSGICMVRPKNCLITRCEITKTGLGGIQLDGPANCTISHNNVMIISLGESIWAAIIICAPAM